jgi:hypothetical protein
MSGDLLFSVMSGSPLTSVFKKTSQLVSEAACYMLLRERRAKTIPWAAEEKFWLTGLMDALTTGGHIFCMGG